jgi:protein-S-isoprenylcysteine O-methyltransferase Ste14
MPPDAMPLTLTARQAVVAPIVVFVWQVIGASRAFRPVEGQRNSSLAGLITFGFIALVVNSATEPVNIVLFAVACVGLVFALLLFEWARRTIRGQYFSWVFSNDTPSILCTSGPFAYVRNPFYTSYLLTMASTVLIQPNAFRTVVFLAMVVYFLVAALHEERKFARSAVAADYARYMADTGRFLPKVTAVRR